MTVKCSANSKTFSAFRIGFGFYRFIRHIYIGLWFLPQGSRGHLVTFTSYLQVMMKLNMKCKGKPCNARSGLQ